MSASGVDPVVTFRRQLQDLYARVWRPAYRVLEAHADHDGRALRRSTISTLLNGPVVPRWETVETFVRACSRYAGMHQVELGSELVDLGRWRAAYRDMENALADQAARRERVAGGAVPARRHRLAVPAQLPADAAGFTGRADHLAELDKLISRADEYPTTVVISAIDGTAGIGKTTLAVHWAHQVCDQFPDGQLYVNLRGFDASGQAMPPAAAVRGFLDALEVPARRIPADPDAQAALYRSLLVDKRVLVVLDNARDTAQVRPLLPGAATCRVVVTSRNQLTSLIADLGAHLISLDVLTDDEARDMLGRRLGADRIAAEPEAVEEIIVRCARLPLALTLVAAHATVRQRTPLRTFAEELRDTRQRWHTLAGDDPTTSVQAVFFWSYRTLTPPAARLFRLLGLHPGPDITAVAAAALTDTPIDEVQHLLVELSCANLLAEHAGGRYTVHDLLRAYAVQRCDAEDPPHDREAAASRLFDWYVHAADSATAPLRRFPVPIRREFPPPHAPVPQVTDQDQALSWLDRERPNLLAMVDAAAGSKRPTHAIQLAHLLSGYLFRRGLLGDNLTAYQHALRSAQQIGDDDALAHSHTWLGYVSNARGQQSQALTHLHLALDMHRRRGDRHGEATTLNYLASVHKAVGRDDEAVDCFQRALDLFRELDDPARQASTQSSLATILHLLGRHDEALAQAHQALELQQRLGGPGLASIHTNLGLMYAQLGRHTEALAHSESALTLHRQDASVLGEANALSNLSLSYVHLGRHADAVVAARHAIDLARRVASSVLEANCLNSLGEVHCLAGDTRSALDCHRQALAIALAADDAEETARARKGIADAG